jgi:hypothetical protein
MSYLVLMGMPLSLEVVNQTLVFLVVVQYPQFYTLLILLRIMPHGLVIGKPVGWHTSLQNYVELGKGRKKHFLLPQHSPSTLMAIQRVI